MTYFFLFYLFIFNFLIDSINAEKFFVKFLCISKNNLFWTMFSNKFYHELFSGIISLRKTEVLLKESNWRSTKRKNLQVSSLLTMSLSLPRNGIIYLNLNYNENFGAFILRTPSKLSSKIFRHLSICNTVSANKNLSFFL